MRHGDTASDDHAEELVYHTLRQWGARSCGHPDREVLHLPLIGWTSLVDLHGPRVRCRWCGATWSYKAERWIGGSLDWPQDVVGFTKEQNDAA